MANLKVTKSFVNVVKGYSKIEGLFNIYVNENKKHALLEIKQDQLNREYLASYTRESGDAYNFDGSSMLNEYVFLFRQIGEKIHFMDFSKFIGFSRKFMGKKNP